MLKVAAGPLLSGLLLLGLVSCGGSGDDDSSAAGDGGASTATAGTPGSGGGGSPGSSGSARQSGPGSCEVAFSGDLQLEAKTGGGPSSFGSDYYYDDDEMRENLEQIAKIANSDASEDEIKRQVDEDMKSDPRLFLLIINCVQDPDFSISLLPGGEAKYADVPFKAGNYRIAEGGLFGADGDSKDFGVLMTTGDDAFYGVSEAGELNITRFDEKGIAGTFSFTAEQMLADGEPKTVKVSGKFDYPCSAGKKCKK